MVVIYNLKYLIHKYISSLPPRSTVPSSSLIIADYCQCMRRPRDAAAEKDTVLCKCQQIRK
jgi:hypothetical protein